MQHLIVSFIGEDRPGLVQALTEVVSAHGGNWEASRMVHLGGHFSGAARIAVPADRVEDVTRALEAVALLTVSVRHPLDPAAGQSSRLMHLNVIGPDRPGILHDVSNALSSHAINVTRIETDVRAASMSGLLNFMADASIEVPESVDTAQLAEVLDEIARSLGIEVLLEDSPEP